MWLLVRPSVPCMTNAVSDLFCNAQVNGYLFYSVASLNFGSSNPVSGCTHPLTIIRQLLILAALEGPVHFFRSDIFSFSFLRPAFFPSFFLFSAMRAVFVDILYGR